MAAKQPTTKKKKKPAAKTFKWKKGTATDTWANSVGISADGKKVVAGCYFFQKNATKLTGVFAWDNHGTALWSDTFMADYGVNGVALSSDGLWTAATGEISSGNGFIYAYDASGHNVLTYNIPHQGWWVALSNDGAYLAAGADAIYVFSRIGSHFDATNVTRIPLPGSTDYVYSVAISSNGQWIVAGTRFGYVGLVENVGGVLGPITWWKLSTTSARIWSVAIAADGSCCAAAGNDGKVHFFDIPGFPTAASFSLTGCTSCQCVAISGNGSLVSAVGNTPAKTGKAFLFDAQTGTQKWSQSLTFPPNNTSMDAAGKFIAVSDGYLTPGVFYLFDTAGTLLWQVPTPQMDWGLNVCSDGSAMAGGSDDSNVYYFTIP